MPNFQSKKFLIQAFFLVKLRVAFVFYRKKILYVLVSFNWSLLEEELIKLVVQLIHCL